MRTLATTVTGSILAVVLVVGAIACGQDRDTTGDATQGAGRGMDRPGAASPAPGAGATTTLPR
jgi:hypothetical protein